MKYYEKEKIKALPVQDAVGKGLSIGDPREGKVGFVATALGLLKINVAALERLNSVQDVIFATLHTDQVVQKGQELAGTRVSSPCPLMKAR